jgi:microcystin-dependent protein
MQDPFVGQITFYPYNFAPKGWMSCEGQLLPITQFSALFSLLGTSFGGNGTTNFGLPDLRGRVPVGTGTLTGGADYAMGEFGGEESVTLPPTEIASHNHALNAITAQGTVNNPSGAILASPFAGSGHGGVSGAGQPYNPGTPNTTLVPASLAPIGGNLAHNNVQPSLVLRPCIAVNGVFPSRN